MSAEVNPPVANGHTSRDATSNEIQQAPPPPHIEATLAQISSYRNVRGVMILLRTQMQSAAESEEAGSHTGGVVHSTGSVFDGEGGRRYARTVETLVGNVSQAVGDCEEGDELRFMRIRTKRHELLITPDPRYLLIVLQDPE